MHRVLLVRVRADAPNKLQVVGDSGNASVSEEAPISIAEAGGTPWEEFQDPVAKMEPGFRSSAASIPYHGLITELGYWHVQATGKVLDYDFAQSRHSEWQIVASGELEVEYNGRRYVARTGDSLAILTDPSDRDHEGKLRPFSLRFSSDHECIIAFTTMPLPD